MRKPRHSRQRDALIHRLLLGGRTQIQTQDYLIRQFLLLSTTLHWSFLEPGAFQTWLHMGIHWAVLKIDPCPGLACLDPRFMDLNWGQKFSEHSLWLKTAAPPVGRDETAQGWERACRLHGLEAPICHIEKPRSSLSSAVKWGLWCMSS